MEILHEGLVPYVDVHKTGTPAQWVTPIYRYGLFHMGLVPNLIYKDGYSRIMGLVPKFIEDGYSRIMG
jgi:hypothetical protein